MICFFFNPYSGQIFNSIQEFTKYEQIISNKFQVSYVTIDTFVKLSVLVVENHFEGGDNHEVRCQIGTEDVSRAFLMNIFTKFYH